MTVSGERRFVVRAVVRLPAAAHALAAGSRQLSFVTVVAVVQGAEVVEGLKTPGVVGDDRIAAAMDELGLVPAKLRQERPGQRSHSFVRRATQQELAGPASVRRPAVNRFESHDEE